MATESPIFLTKVECPVCKTINEFENIKIGAYTEGGQDTDFCPTAREWRNPKYEIYNPLLFFMAACENCFYTREFNKSFKEWKDDVSFKTYRLKNLKSKHLEAVAISGSVLQMFGEARDPQHNPFSTSVVKFLLGVYDEMLNEHPKNLDIGRFFLRIAWLYREHYGSSNKVGSGGSYFARDIQKAYAKLTQSSESFDVSFRSLSSIVDEQFTKQDDRFREQSEFLSLHDEFGENLTQVKELQLKLKAAISQLHKNVTDNSKLVSIASCPDQGGAIRFGGFPSFENFIAEAKTKWEYAPVSEEEALLFAIEFYKAALEEGHEIQPGNQAIQATYMIAELSRRVGKHVDAKQYFNNAVKEGQQFIFSNRNDKTKTALARKIVELAIEQGKTNLSSIKE